jgi:hypothetical protein
MAKSIGDIVNAGLLCLKEPEIASFTTTNILQRHLIREANNAIREILALRDFEWGLKHTVLVTADDITTGTVTVTNASTTVVNSGNNWGSVAAGMYFRVDGDRTSYEIASVNTGANPDELTLATAYVGTTSSTATYRIFKDTYAISTSDLDEIEIAAYGEGQTWAMGVSPDNRIYLVSLSQIFSMSGGDLHLDTSGKPKFIARISVDSSDYPRYVLWPFPTDDYVIDIWYKILYSENSTFATNLFGGDAPQIAYDAVEHYVCAAAYKWDNMSQKASDSQRRYQESRLHLLRRENSHDKEQSMSLYSPRRDYSVGIPGRSGTYFDTKSSLWSGR